MRRSRWAIFFTYPLNSAHHNGVKRLLRADLIAVCCRRHAVDAQPDHGVRMGQHGAAGAMHMSGTRNQAASTRAMLHIIVRVATSCA